MSDREGLHPLIVWELERRQAAGERHRRRRRELARFTQPVGDEPEPPGQPLTAEHRVFLFMQWAVGAIELHDYVGEGEYQPPRHRVRVRGARQVADRWLEVRGPGERGAWEPLLEDRYLYLFATALVARSDEST